MSKTNERTQIFMHSEYLLLKSNRGILLKNFGKELLTTACKQLQHVEEADIVFSNQIPKNTVRWYTQYPSGRKGTFFMKIWYLDEAAQIEVGTHLGSKPEVISEIFKFYPNRILG